MVMSRVSAWTAAALSANQTGANHVTHDRLRNLDHLLRDEHPRPIRGFKQPSLALVHACRKAASLTALAAPAWRDVFREHRPSTYDLGHRPRRKELRQALLPLPALARCL